MMIGVMAFWDEVNVRKPCTHVCYAPCSLSHLVNRVRVCEVRLVSLCILLYAADAWCDVVKTSLCGPRTNTDRLHPSLKHTASRGE